MPIYQYRCAECGHEWSQQEAMAEHGRRPPECPKCGARAAEPVLSPFFAKTIRKS
ncbi:MAG TPA: zinc ribbon domain-containing protein [Gemmatimonadales bacterium]|nr:zinc ribbon domain-containing protein [Gemmatimonadales bacterium]